MKKINNLKIVDNSFDDSVILWSHKKNHEKQLSIIDFLEKNSNLIKNEFCNLVNNFSSQHYKKKKVHEYFIIQKNHSVFWSSNFYEKSFYKNSEILNQLKLIALEKLLKSIKPKKVCVNIKSDIDTISIIKLCNMMNIKYINQKYNFFKYKNIFSHKIFISMFAIIKFIKFLYFRISLKKINWKNIQKSKSNNIFFTYSNYSDKKKISDGKYNSTYWDPLIESNLIKKNLLLNIYFHTPGNSVRKEIHCYTALKKNTIQIIFIEQLFNLKIFFKILISYFKFILSIYSITNSIKDYLKEKKLNFLFYHWGNYFNKSFFGLDFIVGIYYYFLFLELSNKISINKKIFYLFENQGWEKSLNSIFSSNNKTIAVNHASIRFWDLRFTNDLNMQLKYQPTYYAANGKDSLKKLLENRFKRNKIIRLEALRYYDLIKNINIKKNLSYKKILIVTDIHDESNKSLEKLLKFISFDRFKKYKFLLKEHPLKKVNFKLNINLERTSKKIYDLKEESKLAIVSNTTSASIDLLLMGFDLIIPSNLETLNFSPLKDHKNVSFISKYENINDIMIQKLKSKSKINNKQNFYYYSNNLKAWKKILNEY